MKPYTNIYKPLYYIPLSICCNVICFIPLVYLLTCSNLF